MNPTSLSVEYVGLDRLRPEPFNPRRMSEAEMDALIRSIREFGFVEPLVARRDDMTIIGGHQRLLAARRLGHDRVPVVFIDVSPEQAKLLNLALNKIAGSWDEALLARLLGELEVSPTVDLSLSGARETFWKPPNVK